MKKAICLLISIIFVMGMTGCMDRKPKKDINISENKTGEVKNTTVNENVSKNNFPFTGQWQVVRAEYEKIVDPMRKAMSAVVKNHFKDGSVITLSEDFTGSVDGESINYKWERGLLTIIFDETKNINFEISFDDGKLEMEIDDLCDLELVKK